MHLVPLTGIENLRRVCGALLCCLQLACCSGWVTYTLDLDPWVCSCAEAAPSAYAGVGVVAGVKLCSCARLESSESALATIGMIL